MKRAVFLAGVFLVSALVCAAHAQTSAPQKSNDAKAQSQPQEFRQLVNRAQSAEKKGNLEQAQNS